ncbi:hypothetical protein N7532_008209 [Penicillium argentinense]|uniref:GPI anchored protein n=1 Tax=Penicillium argentinense TaxID=1131581 RepID=A0A9W9EXA4_9EURO|nr:uncharacterized protein N7532_008209 [Penicillium argentinense]KAJ5089525.1 hypothetical protein N7532_008209 [Penicillium argentinense]
MRASWWVGIWATFLPTTVLSIEAEPFSLPEQGKPSRRALEVLRLLRRDDDNCPSGYNACSDLGNSDACCKSGTRCTTDAADNIACCRTGASCTGSLTGPSTGSSETGSSFMFPQGTSATTTAEGTAASVTGSTVDGAYPFIYVPTTFANHESCSSYYLLCQSEYTQCTGNLMGRYGVTVGGAGGAGVTVEAITGSAQATSICSSLSAKACHGLQLHNCATAATGTSTQDASGNAAIPARTSSLHDLAFGLIVGVAGMFV